MDKEQVGEEGTPTASAERPGDILRRAREAKGMSLADVAEHTRIAMRQLEAVERNDFAALPGTPYAVGFSRAFARAVGTDEVAVASAVRAELGASAPGGRYEMFEPIDPARVPPRWIAWIATIIAILLAVGYGVWRSQISSPPTDAELSSKAKMPAANTDTIRAPIPEASASSGTVVLTAISDVWLRIYDQTGERLFEKQMAKGESYAVPTTAHNPMLLTGRPEALLVTVDGRQMAPLGPPETAITDMPISAAALLARLANTQTASNAPDGPAAPARTVTRARPATPVTADSQAPASHAPASPSTPDQTTPASAPAPAPSTP